MKLFKLYIVVFSVILAGLVFILTPTFFFSGEDIDLPVYSKTKARDIAKQMKEKGIIHFEEPFLILAKLTRADRHLKAGLYRLNGQMSLWDVLTTLSEGKSALLALKVPEGFTVEQIALNFQKINGGDEADFLKAAQNQELLKRLGVIGPTAEGFLFPETYNVPLGASCDELVELMIRQFWDVVGPDFAAKCKAQGLTPYKMVVLASIVEKEARNPEDRPIIAGILYNRLHLRRALQVNATLNYVLNTKHAWLTTNQIKNTDTPYNTYKYRGLPPTPICNPGAASLKAVLEPADVPYLYYVAAGDGSSLFATTFEEHQKNVRQAKKVRRAKRAEGTSSAE
jgi:UPF0755 protein